MLTKSRPMLTKVGAFLALERPGIPTISEAEWREMLEEAA
jgi:hypothetical protein